MADEKYSITVNNSKDSADMDNSWHPDEKEIFDKIKNATNSKTAYKEMYLITDFPVKMADITEDMVKYPHHKINDEDEMIVSKSGVIAAYDRLMANDPNNEKALKHINKHRKELGIGEFDKSIQQNNTSKKKEVNSFKGRIIELSSEQVTNRRNIKWIVHRIDIENLNGCNFKEPYVSNNIDSAKNMMLFACFLDDTNNSDKKYYYDHGEEATADGSDCTFPNTDIVGCATDAYIQDVNIDGEIIKCLVAEGYLQEDKYPTFVQELKEELDNGNAPKTSVEIVKKKDTDCITYVAGKWTPTNRTPISYDYNGSCFVINPSDKAAVLFELNSVSDKYKIDNKKQENNSNCNKKNKEVNKKVSKSNRKLNIKVELNELALDDVWSIIRDEFNEAMTPDDWDKDYSYCGYWMYKPYPTYVIMQGWDDSNVYYKVPYSINANGKVTLGDAIRVEATWSPITEDVNDNEDEAPIQIDLSAVKEAINIKNKTKQDNNSCKKNEVSDCNEGGNKDMEDNTKKMEELNSKVEELSKKIEELNSKNVESEKKTEELNSAIVEANKTIESKNTEINKITEELNSLRDFKVKADEDNKKTEINNYFEKEIKANGFTEVELNSLKTDYVDKMDLEGLKNAEKDLALKKVKELNSVNKEVKEEVNSNKSNELFVSITNTEKSTDDYSDLY